jgi:2,4-dienoyl-CoA reductase [(3E)-enoyl-CoA-producing], mitochondrial
MFKDAMTARLPAQRLGEPEELANLAAYLVSDYASWLSGQVVTLDGGEVRGGGLCEAVLRASGAESCFCFVR